jgi:hypothetical protein
VCGKYGFPNTSALFKFCLQTFNFDLDKIINYKLFLQIFFKYLKEPTKSLDMSESLFTKLRLQNVSPTSQKRKDLYLRDYKINKRLCIALQFLPPNISLAVK